MQKKRYTTIGCTDIKQQLFVIKKIKTQRENQLNNQYKILFHNRLGHLVKIGERKKSHQTIDFWESSQPIKITLIKEMTPKQ